jgi:hypothetical protein
MNRTNLLRLVTVVILAAIGCVVGVTSAQGPPTEKQMLQAVAQIQKVDLKDLKVPASSSGELPLTGQKLWYAKVFDEKTDTVYGIAMDAEGNVVDEEKAARAEWAARLAKYGKLQPQLFDMLKGMGDKETLEVAIWLVQPERPLRPDPMSFAELSDGEKESRGRELQAESVSAVQDAQAPLLADLATWGVEPAYVAEYGPVVVAILPKEMIQKLSLQLYVDRIYPPGKFAPEMQWAAPSILANKVWSRGYRGSGVKVGVVEVGDKGKGGGRIYDQNRWIRDNLTTDYTWACSSPHNHGTAVMGIIKGKVPFFNGIARDVQAWIGGSCTESTANLLGSEEHAISWGARAINNSWGVDTNLALSVFDRYFESYVRDRAVTVVKSAGNEGCENGHVTSPGLAYNIIAVGNYQDKGSASWWGDSMASSSSYVDPPSSHNDREKPEVAAPGEKWDIFCVAPPPFGIWTTQGSGTGWSPGISDALGGTSYAAPMVTGGAALLMQRAPVLTYWPEGVKAILMASANHNIEGDPLLSDKDGAGGINLDAAFRVAANDGSTGAWGTLWATCQEFEDNGDIERWVYAKRGEHVRAAIVWDTSDQYWDYDNRPGADLDLWLRDPDGGCIYGSYSWDNTYEIADFVTGKTGWYKLIVHSYRCDYDPAWGAWAWYREPYLSSFSTAACFDYVSPGVSGGPMALSATSEFPGDVDFDGDGRSDIGVWRDSTGEWSVLTSNSNWTSSIIRQWGAVGDILVPAKYTTTSRTDMAVWRPSNGTWYVLGANSDFNSSFSRQWGTETDLPVPADYDGDGRTDIGVWRPSDGNWYVLPSASDFTPGAWAPVQWGAEGDVPIARDIDQDGRTDFGVWRTTTGTWYFLLSSRGYDRNQPLSVQWGSYDAGDQPVIANFDNSGWWDFGVWRQSTGTWYLLLSSQGYNTNQALVRQWGSGTEGDIPITRDFDGDGQAELAVWRPSNGTWYILRSLQGYNPGAAWMIQWGSQNDIPVIGKFTGTTAAYDFGVWRGADADYLDGWWYILTAASGFNPGASINMQWGWPGDSPL